MSASEFFDAFNLSWEFVFNLFVFFVICFHQPFKGKNWLLLASVCWLIQPIMVVILEYSGLSYELESSISTIIWSINSMGYDLFLPMFFLTVWSNKHLNIQNHSLLFSFKSRIPRSLYWVVSFLFTGVMIKLALSIDSYGGNSVFAPWHKINISFIYVGILLLLHTWIMLAINVKRWHDHDKSGWYLLLCLIPVVGLFIALIVLGCQRGTQGDNRFGEDPLKSKDENEDTGILIKP